jgi:hypothetical protein
MSLFLKLLLTLGLISCLSATNLYATSHNHYVNGIEGVKAATTPPPGFYYRMCKYSG